MKISIVTSLYKVAPFISEFYSRCKTEVQKTDCDYEFVFVNDGSPDESLDKVLDLQKQDSLVTVIDLSKNFGHHLAIMTGLEHATGDYIFSLDCDLEEPPEALGEFYSIISQTENLDVVYGVRSRRKDPLFTRLISKVFYYVFESLSGISSTKDNLFMRLMTKRYVQALVAHEEKHLFIGGLFHLVGFEQVAVEVAKDYKGSTGYSFRKRLALAINGLLSFSSKPLYIIIFIGFILALGATLGAGYLVYTKLRFNLAMSGWTSIMVSIWFLSGCILIAIGVIGIYIAKIFEEVKRRPRTIIKDIFR